MHLFALILGIWLLPKGDTLKCFECIPDNSGTCTPTQRECPSQNHQCGASILISNEGFPFVNYTTKGCVLPEECGEGSSTSLFFKIFINTRCCNSDLCNTQSVPIPVWSKTPPNGRQCFTCDGPACDKTLACEGNEDYCATIKGPEGGTITTLKGCASKLICSASNIFPSQLQGTKLSCCKGNLCNSAVTASAGLQLVVVALVSLTLFS